MKYILALALILTTTPAMAKTISVGVNGLVCAFCATAIENSLKEKDGVKSTKVDLDAKLVTIDFVDGKEMSDKDITKTLTDAGYTVTNIKR